MAVRLTDSDIQALIKQSKPLGAGLRSRLVAKPKRGHKEAEVRISGAEGSTFAVIVRESLVNPHDFSVILAAELTTSEQLFRLRRYNGRSHRHTNAIEGSSFFDFHIHTASERYQELGRDEDAYAEPTSRYSALTGAINCMLDDCGFERDADDQGHLPFAGD